MKISGNLFFHGFFVVLLAICFQSSFAQQGTVSSGGNATGSGGSVSYSFGQVFYSSVLTGSGSVTQGIQQSFNSTPLPVRLISFEALAIPGENYPKVLIHWTSAEEINNDFFTIEKSINGTVFTQAVHIHAAEQGSGGLRDYSWTDSFPYSGTSYYRLKQTDLDQTFTYSTIRAVKIDNAANAAYPNPVQGNLYLNGFKKEARSYQIFDLSGRIVQESTLKAEETIIDMSRLSRQLYLIRMVGASEIKLLKILKN